MDRKSNKIEITFRAGQTRSEGLRTLHGGAFGTFIVPSGSEAASRSIQVFAVEPPGTANPFPRTALLTTAKNLVSGSNAFNEFELTEVGAVGTVDFELNIAVTADTTIWLLWKN